MFIDLVLEVYRCVEVGYLGVDGLADDVSLAAVHEGTHFYQLRVSTMRILSSLCIAYPKLDLGDPLVLRNLHVRLFPEEKS